MDHDNIAINTNKLTKHFGGRKAVDTLNIQIRKGEIFSLLGTNGAGKTTTIKMLCCLLRPTAGDATVLDMNISAKPQKIKEVIGVSPQETAIAEHLTTRENLLLMGGVHGLHKADREKRASNLMELMELEDRKDQVRRLSGGLQRRLSIAMALMSDPRILFLDEPTLGLDPHARKSVWNYIEKLKSVKTILLTTHYLEEADKPADHIAIMDQGRIVAKGTPEELKVKFRDKKTLRVETDGVAAEGIRLLEKMGNEVQTKKNILEIRNDAPDFYGIMHILQQNRVVIKSIKMEEPSLDEIFLKLTGKEAGQ